MVVKLDELNILKALIQKAGRAVLKYYGRTGEVWYKSSNNSPVTQADLVSQDIILDGLRSFGYPLLSEERADNKMRLKSERVWIIDPLDGTKDFLQKTGEFSILIGLVEHGRPILGAVYQPTNDLLYYAIKGQGAFKQERGGSAMRIHVSQEKDPRRWRMLLSRHHLLPLEVSVGEALQVRNGVQCGSAGVKAGLIAEGKAELYVTVAGTTGEWDTCAADIIMHEAGGSMTDMNGRLLIYNKKNPRNEHGFVVTNSLIHDYVIEVIKMLSSR